MLSNIKQELINNPDKLIELLEYYGYCNVVNHGKYLSLGRDEYSSKKSIVIRLENNDWLFVKDYARNYSGDIFAFISTQRNVEFKDVLSTVKSILNIDDYYIYFKKKCVFNGFYERTKGRGSTILKIYDESILDEYSDFCNLRFFKDNISLDAQKAFDIRYDITTNGIVIPIRTQTGDLMGIKARRNDDDSNLDKYWYLIPCQMSQTLYGYSQNYKYLINDTVLVFEAEKSVMQCYSYGIRNAVALGSGSISQKQCKMIEELNPSKIIFMHDYGYEYPLIMKNIDAIKNIGIFNEIELGFWDWKQNLICEDKSSPSDMGKEELRYILDNEIKWIGDENIEESGSIL